MPTVVTFPRKAVGVVMAEVAGAFVSLMPSAKGFGAKLNSQIGGDLDKSGREGGKRYGTGMAAGLKSVGGLLAGAFAAAKVTDFLRDSVAEARESQKVGAITAQVIKTTGAAAKITADQVGSLSTAISNQTGIDDEAIQSGANLLLTFKNIRNEAGQGNDIFNQTTSIMTDMATAMGQEPKAAAIQLGKALNDPIKGITALTRVGVTFSDQQKDQIKTLVQSGNVMGAQKIILAELQSEFGGTAAAGSTAGEKMATAFGNFKEQIGTALLPIIDRFAGTMTTTVIPAMSRFLTEMQDGTGRGGQFVATVRGIADGAKTAASFLNEHRAIVVGVAGAYVAFKVAQLGVAAANAISLVSLKAHTVGTIENTVATKAAAVAAKVWTAGQWLLNAALSANPIGLVILAVAALVAGVVIAYQKSETFRNIVTAAFNAVKNAAVAAFNWVKANWPLILGIITGPIGLAVVAVVKNWDRITAGAAAMKNAVVGKFGELVDWIKGIPGRIVGALGNVGSILTDAGRSIISGLLRGIVDQFEHVKGFVSGIGPWIADHKGPLSYDRRLLVPAGKAIIGGLNEGLMSEMGGLERTLGRVTDTIRVAPLSRGPSLAAAGGSSLSFPDVMRLHPDDLDYLARKMGDRVLVNARTGAR